MSNGVYTSVKTKTLLNHIQLRFFLPHEVQEEERVSRDFEVPHTIRQPAENKYFKGKIVKLFIIHKNKAKKEKRQKIGTSSKLVHNKGWFAA